MENKKIGLYSGRFDPPHLGHVITTLRCLESYDMLKIVVLDYDTRQYSADYAKQVLSESLTLSNKNFEIYINTVHFGKITKEEILQFAPFTHYLAGNSPVLAHVGSLGIPVRWVDRAYHYSAEDQRLSDNLKSLLKTS